MTKQQLAQYPHICRELKHLQARRDRLQAQALWDTVPLSGPGAFSTSRDVALEAAMERTRLLCTIRDREVDLEAKRRELEGFVAGIQDSRMRQLIQLRFVEGWTWKRVALHLGWRDEQRPRKALDRYLARTKGTKSPE